MTIASVALLAGCAALPRSGPVHEGREAIGSQVAHVQAKAAPPAEDASPTQIVEGFLQAMLAGASDNFQVARSYLANDIAATWDPLASVTIYKSGEAPLLTESGSQLGRISFTVTRVALVDETGRYRQLATTAETQALTLSQDADQQWRISSLNDGSVIPEVVFRGDYVRVPIYFPSPDGQFLVPDSRVFPRQAAPTAAVKQFLAGPPPYLNGAVSAVVPNGTRLTTDAVSVSDGIALVNLSSSMTRASETARAMAFACLRATLTSISDVQAVDLQIESAPIELAPSAGLTRDPDASSGPYYLGEGGAWLVDEGEAELIGGTRATVGWSTLSVDHTGQRLAGLSGGRLEVMSELGSEAVSWELPGSATPTAGPVFDRLGWLWLAAGDQVVVFDSDGVASTLGATWLNGLEVVALAASRDGTRLALAVLGAGTGQLELMVSGIVRRQGGAPWRLTGPITVGSGYLSLSFLSWSDETTLTFLASAAVGETPAPVELVIGGDASNLTLPTDTLDSLASGTGRTAVYATGQAGGLFVYSANRRVWTSLASGARAVTLAP